SRAIAPDAQIAGRRPPRAPAPQRAETTVRITPEFEQAWRRWLHDGVVPNTAFPPKSVRVTTIQPPGTRPAPAGGLEVVFKSDPTVLDGRFANTGWLQDLPNPITTLTWDNAILVSPATASRLGFNNAPSFQGGEHGQIISRVVELRRAGRAVRGAVFQVVGHPDNCITVHLGYGRSRAGSLGSGAGFNANAIRTSEAMWFAGGIEI